MRVELRSFDPAAAPTVASWVTTDRDLLWLAPRTPPPLTTEKVIEWQEESDTSCMLCTFDDAGTNFLALIGYGEINQMKKDPNHLWIGHVVIAPDHRRNGLGRKFIDLLLVEGFTALDAHTVSLVVFPANQPAIRCYKRAGFAPAGDEFHQFRPGGPKHRMVRMDMIRDRWIARSLRAEASPRRDNKADST